jgi:hypothetical protein
MTKSLTTIICFYLISNCFGQTIGDRLNLLDYENSSKVTTAIQNSTLSYAKAVSNWTTIEDVNNWIKNSFIYDMNRAKLLANNSKSKGQIPIYTPEQFWVIKKGMCVDLSRFAYETAKSIDSTSYVKYLKIEFEPVEIEGNKFVNHWIVAYKENGSYSFFADSRRPGIIDGPYTTVEEFIRYYEKFRGRMINSFELLDAYNKVKMYKSSKKTKS